MTSCSIALMDFRDGHLKHVFVHHFTSVLFVCTICHEDSISHENCMIIE